MINICVSLCILSQVVANYFCPGIGSKIKVVLLQKHQKLAIIEYNIMNYIHIQKPTKYCTLPLNKFLCTKEEPLLKDQPS